MVDHAVYTISSPGFFSSKYEIYLDNTDRVYRAHKTAMFSGNYNLLEEDDNVSIQIIRKSIWNRNYEIFEDGRRLALISPRTLSRRIDIESIFGKQVIERRNWSREFTLFNSDNDEIAKITRKLMSTDGKFAVGIIKGNHEGYILALVIVIDLILRAEQSG